jgi:hypothetical protein
MYNIGGCGVAQIQGAVWLRSGCGVAQNRVRCGSDRSASAWCTAGPSSNPRLEEALYRADAMRITRVVLC